MNFANAVVSGYKNALNFSGRASRSEYWWFVFFGGMLAGLIAIGGVIVGFSGLSATSTEQEVVDAVLRTFVPALVLIWIVVGIPLVAVGFRRLHDMGQSGIWYGLLAGAQIFTTFTGFLSIKANEDSGNASFDLGLGFAGVAFNVLQLIVLVMTLIPSQQGANSYGHPVGYVGDDVPPPPENFRAL